MELTPGRPPTTPYHSDAPPLPSSLIEALRGLREATRAFGDEFGEFFINYDPLPA